MLLNNMIAVTLEVETFPVQSNCKILKFHELTSVDNQHTKISQTITFVERVKNRKKAKIVASKPCEISDDKTITKIENRI